MASHTEVDPRRFRNGTTISNANADGSLTVVLSGRSEDNQVLDILTGRMIQTGMPIVDLSALMIETVRDHEDYVGAWESFQPNILSMVYSTGVRLFVIYIDKIRKRWPVKEVMSIGLRGMFNSMGFQVLALQPALNVNAVIDVQDLRSVQTGSYGLCQYGGLGITKVNDINKYLLDDAQSRRSNGRALRSAIMSRMSVFSLGATLVDVLTAYHSPYDDHGFSGLGLDMPYRVDDMWDGRVADHSAFHDWFSVLSSVKGRYTHVIDTNVNYLDIEFKQMQPGDYFFIRIGGYTPKIGIPLGSTVVPTPYQKDLCIFGRYVPHMSPFTYSMGSLVAWKNKPIEIHHAQARMMVESCIHLRDTLSMVMELRPLELRDTVPVSHQKDPGPAPGPIIFLGSDRTSDEYPYSMSDKLAALIAHGTGNAWYVDGSTPLDGYLNLGESMHAISGPATDTYEAFDHSNNPLLIRKANERYVVLRNDEELTNHMMKILKKKLFETENNVAILTNVVTITSNTSGHLDGLVNTLEVEDPIFVHSLVERVRSSGGRIYDEVHHINEAGTYFLESAREDQIYNIPEGVGVSEYLTRIASRSFMQLDNQPIICLYSLSNAMNLPLSELPKDVIGSIDLFNYPDMSSVNRHSRNLMFGEITTMPVPSMQAFAEFPSLEAPLSDTKYISFTTSLNSPDVRYHAASVSRVIAEDEMFIRPVRGNVGRSVFKKVSPYIEGRLGKRVLMLGEAPGELAEMLALTNPQVLFVVTSKRPTAEDDLTFSPSLAQHHNVTTHYVDAIEAMKMASKTQFDMVISDVGVGSIHLKGVEDKFNKLFRSIIEAHSKYCPQVPMIIKGYTPTLEYFDFENLCYVKPEFSGSLNREFYAIKGWIPHDCLSLEGIVLKQLEALKVVVGDVPDPKYVEYSDWAANPNGVLQTHDFSSTAQFNAYLTFNFPVEEGLLFDPNSDDSRRWLIFNRRAGPFSSQLVDTHANTISYTARIMGTLIRNRVPHMKDDVLYNVRREVGLLYFDEKGISANVVPSNLVVDGVRIGGRVHLEYEENGDKLFASISGHLISEVLYSSMFQSLDFQRFFNIVLKGKPIDKYKNHKVRMNSTKMEIGNILSERQVYDGKVLWHNYHEYNIALRVAICLASTLGIELPRGTIELIRNTLEENRELLMGESSASRTIRSSRAGKVSALNIR